VPVASWFDDITDTELSDLIPFFEKLNKVENVYSVLRNANQNMNSTNMSANNIQQQIINRTSISLISSSTTGSGLQPIHQLQNGSTPSS
jgi:hypothetical protein